MATYYLLIRYNVNGGKIRENPYYYSSGYTSYTSYTASTTYKYMKATSTSANVVGCATASGTYANFQSRVASTTTYPNLMNVATFHIWRGGYHIVGTSAYRTTSTGGNLINQDYSSSSTTNPATYARMGGSTSANKTVTLYVNWTANNYTVQFDANGGTGTMSDVTCTYGTGKALTNTFTRTGYTFAGWACARPFVSSYADCDPVPDAAPTDYAGMLDSITYLTVGGVTYARVISHNASIDRDYEYLYSYNASSKTWTLKFSAQDGSLGPMVAIGSTIYKRAYSVQGEWLFYKWNGSSWESGRKLNTTDDYTYADGESVTNLTWTNGGTVTAYAVWEPKTTPIAFDMNGGTGGPPSPVTATYDQTFTIPTAQPTSNKYFMGWAYAIGVNGQAATSAAHSRADSRIIDYIGGESFTWTAAGGYGVYCAVWSPIAVKTNSYQWERLFQDRDAVSGNPVILEDGETIGLQSGSYWYKINSTYTGWTSISTPSSYTNFSNNYNDCNPKPVSAPTSYTGDLDKERYASINGVTYGYIESSTSNYDYTSLYKLESSWRGTFSKIKVNGVWKDPTAVYVKVNGTWKQLY